MPETSGSSNGVRSAPARRSCAILAGTNRSNSSASCSTAALGGYARKNSRASWNRISDSASSNFFRPSFRSHGARAVCSFKPNARFSASSSIGSRLSEAMRLPLVFLLLLFATVAAFAQDTKLYVVTHVDLTPNHVVDATSLLLNFAADSRKEKGAVRFEVFQEPARKNHITIVSVWENQAA